MAVEPQIPKLVALLTADDVHQDRRTRKHTILGTYNHLCAPSFPWTEPVLVVFLAFAEGHGKITLTLRITDKDELQPPVLETEAEVRFANPVQVLEMPFFGTNVVFPQPGEYRVQVFASGQLLGEKRLIVWRGSMNGKP